MDASGAEDIEQAFLIALEEQADRSAATLVLGEIQRDRAFALAPAASGDGSEHAVLLAHDEPGQGWYAVAPSAQLRGCATSGRR